MLFSVTGKPSFSARYCCASGCSIHLINGHAASFLGEKRLISICQPPRQDCEDCVPIGSGAISNLPAIFDWLASLLHAMILGQLRINAASPLNHLPIASVSWYFTTSGGEIVFIQLIISVRAWSAASLLTTTFFGLLALSKMLEPYW